MGDPYLLDSSVLVDLARLDGRALRLIGALPDDAALTSVTVVRTELIRGAHADDWPSVRRMLDDLLWIPVDVELADLAGRMAARFDRTHPGISLTDYVVAAATRLLGATLLTLNVRHFPMLEGLRPAYD